MYHRLFILVRISNTSCKKLHSSKFNKKKRIIEIFFTKLHIRVVRMSKKKTVATAFFFAQLDIFDKKRISDLI